MLSAAISCEKSSVTGGPRCEPLYLDLTDPAELPEAVAKALGAAGWTGKGGEHFCPRHDPAEVGEIFEVGFQYTPIRDTGWEVRVPPSEFSAMGLNVTWRLEIRPAAAPVESTEPEPVSATDADAAAVEAFLDVLDAHLNDLPRSVQDAGVIAAPEWANVDLRGPWLRSVLAERADLRALAPDSREHDDPFYRPGGVYVSENGWWRFTCKTVAAGVALGVEECLMDRQEPRFTKRNVWRSVRPAGCDHEVDPETGERVDGRVGDDG